MNTHRAAPVIVFVRDLMFSGRIRAAAEAVGRQLVVTRDLATFQQKLCESPDALVFIDLNVQGADPMAAIDAALAYPDAHLVCFLSHVDAEAARQARARGASTILARSAFVTQLPKLLEAR